MPYSKLFCIFLLSLLLLFSACSDSQAPVTDITSPGEQPDSEGIAAPKNPLAGIWKVDDCIISIPAMDSAMLVAATDLIRSTSYYFGEDGSFRRFDDFVPDGVAGTYQHDAVNHQLALDFAFEGRQEHEEYAILNLSASNLTIQQKVFEGRITIELQPKKI